ncbi:MAG TPA: aldehyde dehydrogenase family protein [Bacteroidales bacterium]|nr:aldehyde dehydrogenase family protein [Bacteroidales bacterium]
MTMILPYYAAGLFMEEGRPLPVHSPHDGRMVGQTWQASPEVLEHCIQAALQVRDLLASAPLHTRSLWLARIAEGLKARREEIASTIALESGKPLRYALGEADRSAQTFRVAAEEALRQPGEYLPLDWTPAGEGREAWVRWFPAGLIAGISPFNFPVNLVSHKIAPALAAGCPILLKPSSSTPLSALLLASIIHDAGLPAGAVSILPLRREDGDLMVTDPRFALLSFTGSPEVGWAMKARAGKKKVVLELGGNAGVILAKSADLSLALPRCLSGAFAYSGQVCIHTQRIFVHRSLFPEFTSRFCAAASALKTGDPLDPATEFAGLIDEANALRVEAWVQEALQEGARLLCGGGRQGSQVEPTVLTQTDDRMKVCALEVFGPVVTVEPFDEMTEAVARINSGRYGLQAGLFTDSATEMNLAFRQLEVGGVIINDVPTFRVDHMPYGGVKDSGQGREGVRDAMIEMMEKRVLVKPV